MRRPIRRMVQRTQAKPDRSSVLRVPDSILDLTDEVGVRRLFFGARSMGTRSADLAAGGLHGAAGAPQFEVRLAPANEFQIDQGEKIGVLKGTMKLAVSVVDLEAFA